MVSFTKMMMIVLATRALNLARANLTQGLRVEVLHDSNHKGICSEAYYSAFDNELFDFGKLSAGSVLKDYGLSTDDFEFEPFHLRSMNVRTRRFLRSNDSQPKEQGQADADFNRDLRQDTNTCAACTKPSCMASCSGCYLCNSQRRDLAQQRANTGLVALTPEILRKVEVELQNNVEEHFVQWLTKGPGASLAVGCLGDPKKLTISVSFV